MHCFTILVMRHFYQIKNIIIRFPEECDNDKKKNPLTNLFLILEKYGAPLNIFDCITDWSQEKWHSSKISD